MRCGQCLGVAGVRAVVVRRLGARNSTAHRLVRPGAPQRRLEPLPELDHCLIASRVTPWRNDGALWRPASGAVDCGASIRGKTCTELTLCQGTGSLMRPQERTQRTRSPSTVAWIPNACAIASTLSGQLNTLLACSASR